MKRETPAGCLVRYYDYEAPASGTSKLHFPRQPGYKSRALLRGTDMR